MNEFIDSYDSVTFKKLHVNSASQTNVVLGWPEHSILHLSERMEINMHEAILFAELQTLCRAA